MFVKPVGYVGQEPEPENSSNKDDPSPKRLDNKPQSFANQFRKTRMCRFYLAGKCTRGANCTHAHDETELQHAPDLSKTSMCRNIVEKGECNKPNCNYAHHLSELKCSNTFFKTRYCRFFLETGTCKLGDKCRYAHNDSELRDSNEAKEDTPGFHKQSMHNEVSDFSRQASPTALPFPTKYSTSPPTTALPKEAFAAADQSQQMHLEAEMIARQNMMAAAMVPPHPSVMPQPPTDSGKTHEEMASIFVAAAQAHLMEADRQKLRAAQGSPMGLMPQAGFPEFGHAAPPPLPSSARSSVPVPPPPPRDPWMQVPPRMPTHHQQPQMMYDQSMYHQMPYPPSTGYTNAPEQFSPDDFSGAAAAAALVPSQLPRPPSHHSLRGLGGSSASLKGLEVAASLKGLKGLGGSHASLASLEAAAREVANANAGSPSVPIHGSSRKGKGGVSFGGADVQRISEGQEESIGRLPSWSKLWNDPPTASFSDIPRPEQRNYVTKNTFIEVPDQEAIAKETLKRVNMSAPTNLFAWKGGSFGAGNLGGLLETDSQFSDEQSNADAP